MNNYTQQVQNPDQFIRFDLTEGIPWFQKELKQWIHNIPLNSVIHYPSANHTNIKSHLSRWLHIQNTNMLLGSGSDELIELIARTFLKKSDKALIPAPSFFRFFQASERAGAQVKKVLFSIKDGFEWSPEFTTRFIQKAKNKDIKIIWLASPNNPTGVTIPDKILEKILETGKIVVLDKALNGFTKELRTEAKRIWSFPNLIILSSFSKTFGLPGLRFGFLISSSSIVEKINEFRLPFNLSGTTLWIVKKLLETIILGKIKIKEQINLLREKKRLELELANIYGIRVGSSSKANFLLIQSTKNRSLFEFLKQNNILVADMNLTVGIKNKNFIRITVKSPKENSGLIKILQRFIFYKKL